jgi:hypothetical protein
MELIRKTAVSQPVTMTSADAVVHPVARRLPGQARPDAL